MNCRFSPRIVRWTLLLAVLCCITFIGFVAGWALGGAKGIDLGDRFCRKEFSRLISSAQAEKVPVFVIDGIRFEIVNAKRSYFKITEQIEIAGAGDMTLQGAHHDKDDR